MSFEVSAPKPIKEKEVFFIPENKKASKQERKTIYDIKRETEETEPYFFKHETMKFFHQRLSDFSVYKMPNGKYKIVAPMKDHEGRVVGYTKRIYNPETKKLEMTE